MADKVLCDLVLSASPGGFCISCSVSSTLVLLYHDLLLLPHGFPTCGYLFLECMSLLFLTLKPSCRTQLKDSLPRSFWNSYTRSDSPVCRFLQTSGHLPHDTYHNSHLCTLRLSDLCLALQLDH